MPGTTLLSDDDGLHEGAVDEALESARFFDDYGVERHVENDRFALATTGYDGYPVRVVRTDGAVVVFEGFLYGAEDGEARIREVGTHLREGRTDAVREWMLSRDGDYLVTVLDGERGVATVLTDALGRLPVYAATVGSTTVVSRELGLVRELGARVGDPPPVDRLGVAQTLLFGYRLGTRTLFEGVERLPPASVATVGDDLAVERLHRHDFGEPPRSRGSLAENATRLADRFVEACRDRAELPGGNVVALSGGLDSRAVAAGYAATGRPFRTATFDRPDGSAADEVRAARRVAAKLDVEWESYVAAATEGHRRRLLETKQGMNYLRLAFLLDFLEKIDADRGDVTYVTGDGGDKALPDLTPARAIDGEHALVRFVVGANSVFDPAEAAEVAGVPERRLLASVRERLRSYPETDHDALYVHFLVRERGMNWLFQGEDRNRYYYWSVSPFYAWPFFREAMRCPADQKAGDALRERFLGELSPDLVDVEYVNYGAPITSTEYRLKRSLYGALSRYPSVRDAAVTTLKRLKGDGPVSAPSAAREVRRRVSDGSDGSDGSDVEAALSRSAAGRVANNPDSYSAPAMYHLLTVARLAEGRPAG